jgi:hypothetical protein
MKYQISISVNSLDVPESENIPQHATAVFETTADQKSICVGKILIGMGQAWTTLETKYEQNNFREVKVFPKPGTNTTVLRISGKDIELIPAQKNRAIMALDKIIDRISRILQWKMKS